VDEYDGDHGLEDDDDDDDDDDDGGTVGDDVDGDADDLALLPNILDDPVADGIGALVSDGKRSSLVISTCMCR